jgi:hypothetical protein
MSLSVREFVYILAKTNFADSGFSSIRFHARLNKGCCSVQPITMTVISRMINSFFILTIILLQNYGYFIIYASLFHGFSLFGPFLSATFFLAYYYLSSILSRLYIKNTCNTPDGDFQIKTLRGSYIHPIFAIGLNKSNH